MGAPPREERPDRFYNWASSRARYEYNPNTVDENGMAPRDVELEKALFETDAAEQQTTLDFSRYENIPIRVERAEGIDLQPVKTVSNEKNSENKRNSHSLFLFFADPKIYIIVLGC